MKAEIINPFIESVVYIFGKSCGTVAVPGQAYIRTQYPYTTESVTAVIDITGEITGRIIMSIPVKCANGIVSRALKTGSYSISDSQGKSALSELLNIISGNALNKLSGAGYVCDITPPTVTSGKKIKVDEPKTAKTIVVPIDFNFGKMEINFALSVSHTKSS